MSYKIELYKRPDGVVVDQVVEIAQLLTSRWFTPEVPGTIRKDLAFYDLMCLEDDGVVVSFIAFTSMDGCINIMLMGTHPDFHSQGFGTLLMHNFSQYVESIGFDTIIALTVPPDTKEAYTATVKFYEKSGFVITRRYNDLWQTGALELTKRL